MFSTFKWIWFPLGPTIDKSWCTLKTIFAYSICLSAVMLQEIQEHILWHPLGFIIVSKSVSPCSVTPFFDLSCWNFYPRDSQMYFIYTNLWCTCITYTVCELVLWSLLQNCCFLMEFTWFYVVLRFTEVTISDSLFLPLPLLWYFAILVDLLLLLVFSTTHEKHQI